MKSFIRWLLLNRHYVVRVLMLIDHWTDVVDYEVNQVQKRIWFAFKEIFVISDLSFILLYLLQSEYSVHEAHALDQVTWKLKVECEVLGKHYLKTFLNMICQFGLEFLIPDCGPWCFQPRVDSLLTLEVVVIT